jgi:sugar porter (SP) family MFS transporter
MKSDTTEARRATYVYVLASIAAAGGFNGGYDLMLMSGAILSMSRFFHIYSMHVVLFSHTVGGAWIEGFTMTSAWYGILAGMIVAGYLTDRIGRRGTLIFGAVLLIISALGTTMPKTLLIWNVFRIVGGVGGGLTSIASPVYISEIAPAEKRGALVTFNILAVVLGALLSNLATYLIARFLGTNPECWRWMFASAALPMMIFLVGLFFIPESPRWLFMQDRVPEARTVLTRVGGADHAAKEIREINQTLGSDIGSYRDLIRPGVRMALLITVGLVVFQQLAGPSTLSYYGPTIFLDAGMSSDTNAIGSTVILRVGDLVCTLLTIYLVDKVGRRSLLLVGSLGVGLGQFLMGLFFFKHYMSVWVLLAFLLCGVAFDLSLGALPWLITTELFSNRLRARGMAIVSFVSMGLGLVLAQVFPPFLQFFQRHFGSVAGVFWTFAAFCVGAFVFSIFLVPETKGRTLEEISSSYTGRALSSETLTKPDY